MCTISASMFNALRQCLFVYCVILLLLKLCYVVNSSADDTDFIKLYKACEENDTITCIAILKKRPHYVNRFKLPEGYTPFMMACAYVNTPLVKYMLEIGAQVSLKSKNNETPFYLAAFYHIRNKDSTNASCIRELYYAGANINEPTRNITPLQLAAIFGHTSLVKWLLIKKATVNTNPHPYFLAKNQGHHETANLIACAEQFKSICC
ncbi:hypothetical protein ABEB36_014912 [Hypothenemus hampei]|uniref:Ankyrin repeat domain-containing protein n=1 Tax=Hypothenemus hampei TaxID=57062 RepID=A0ABD1E271_HYPHA